MKGLINMSLLFEWLVLGLWIYQWMIVAYVLVGWFPEYRHSNFYRTLSDFVEPYIAVFRKWIPPIGMFDVSTIVALIVLQFVIRGLGG